MMDKVLVPATFSLHSTDPLRRVSWTHEEPIDLDLLYYTQKEVPRRVYQIIEEEIELGDLKRIQDELSKFI